MMELETFFTVPEQTRLLLYAVLLGVPLGMCFDVLRTLRLLLPHGKLATALEDVLFLLLWSGALLCFSTALARGEFRGYYVLGSGLGFLLYFCTLGCVTVPLLRRILTGIGRLFRWLLYPVFHGVVRICTLMYKKFGHFAKVFWKASFFSHLPLQRDREMLYNKNRFLKRKAALQWQKKCKPKKAGRAGSIGSSAGQR